MPYDAGRFFPGPTRYVPYDPCPDVGFYVPCYLDNLRPQMGTAISEGVPYAERVRIGL